ncbi:protein EFR3 homolog B, partial [Agelaius tricolor]|uniref:protein EFR3 homolog B n=1 Tax=Agelaius tricolor TaxID=9191 RepID=UPI0039F178B7
AKFCPQSGEEERLCKRKSIGETISLHLEVESSSSSSPRAEQRAPAEEITYETLKKAIADSVAAEERERERRRLLVQRFQKAPFEEIAAHCGARASLLQSKLNQILHMSVRPPPSPSGAVPAVLGPSQSPQSQSQSQSQQSQSQSQPPHSIPVYEMKFPDLCVY